MCFCNFPSVCVKFYFPFLHLCVSDVTPASFETPVGRSGSPSSTPGTKLLNGGMCLLLRKYCNKYSELCM